MSEAENFISLSRLISNFTRFWCLNCFHIPLHRNVAKMQVKPIDIRLFIFQFTLYSTILSTHIYYQMISSTRTQMGTAYTLMKYIHFLHGCNYLLNICMDFYNRNRVWFIICSIYDFDLVVSLSNFS